MAKLMMWLLGLCLVNGANAYAGVRFITDAPRHAVADKRPSGLSSAAQSRSKCKKAGYAVTSCSAGYNLTTPCPYDSRFYADCCHKKYRYTADYCLAHKMAPSATSCGGLYSCEKN